MSNREYLPVYALPYWETIGDFVQSVVDDCEVMSDRDRKSLYAATTPFVLWCWQARGLPLDRLRMFRATVIDQFIHLGTPNYVQGSRATIRSTLWRILEIVNPAESVRFHRPIPRSASTAPYKASEVAELHSWALSQGTERRKRDAITLLALGLGGGLATREILATTKQDVAIHSELVQLMVRGTRDRVVPVLPRWQPPLRSLVDELSAEELLFRPGRVSAAPGQISDFLMRARTELDVRPSRMRATWLVHHLNTGTPSNELLQISGLLNFAAFDKLTPFTFAGRPEAKR